MQETGISKTTPGQQTALGKMGLGREMLKKITFVIPLKQWVTFLLLVCRDDAGLGRSCNKAALVEPSSI